MASNIRSTRFRPVKSTEKLSQCYFAFRVTPQQRQMLVDLAKERDISISGLIREIISERLSEIEEKKNSLTGTLPR